MEKIMSRLTKLLTILVTLGVIGGSASAQQTIYRDSKGHRTGSAEQTTTYRDKLGNKTGSAEKQNGVTVYRDKRGNRTGTAEHKN
jgi:hypothetical protein